MTTNGSAFVNLWKYSFNYLAQTKGLKNIIWLMPYSGAPDSDPVEDVSVDSTVGAVQHLGGLSVRRDALPQASYLAAQNIP